MHLGKSTITAATARALVDDQFGQWPLLRRVAHQRAFWCRTTEYGPHNV